MIFASLFALMFVGLSIAVIKKRRALKIATGTGGSQEMEYAIRAHGNFAEYVPLALILLAGAELNNSPAWVVIGIGALLLIGRLLHAHGFLIATKDTHFKFRVSGMALTFTSLILLAITNMIAAL